MREEVLWRTRCYFVLYAGRSFPTLEHKKASWSGTKGWQNTQASNLPLARLANPLTRRKVWNEAPNGLHSCVPLPMRLVPLTAFFLTERAWRGATTRRAVPIWEGC